MFNSAILDVAVGLVLMYLVLALACTSINEYVSRLLGLRGAILRQGVQGLFQNSPKAAEFAQQLYDHDLIDALSPATDGAQPSYIPSHVFSLALVDKLGIHAAPVTAGTPVSVVSMLNDSPVDPSIKKILWPLAVAAGTDIDQFRQNVESWFDATMQRVSGWYKRRMQAITFWVALSVCLICNADSMSVADTLWSSPTVRAQLTAPAAGVAASHLSAISTVPAAGTAGSAHVGVPAPLTTDAPSYTSAESLATSLVGWSGPIFPWIRGYDRANVHRFPDGLEWVWKLLGVLITVVAVSLGAPFWFGVLNKILSVKNAAGIPGAPTAGSRIVSAPVATTPATPTPDQAPPASPSCSSPS
jgi:hypothetical protein